MLNLVVAIAVLAHGIGHILFLVPAVGIANWADQTGHSWLLAPVLGDGVTRAVAALVWSAATLLFVGGVAGFWMSLDWWRPVTIAAAIVSIAGIVVFWDGIAASNAFLAVVFDVVVLVALLWIHWPATQAELSV